MKTSIVILTYNQLNYTIQCIESIRQYTNSGTYEIIIVDNNSTDETRQWLSQQSDIITILNDSNLGFPKGCNQGIEVATGDYILLLNNDTVVTENWLNNMLYCINSDERFGAVSCITNNCSYAQTIPVSYNNLHEMHAFAAGHNVPDQSKWEQRLKLIGFCYLIKRSVVDEIGLLDERFTPGNYEDDDYSLRIRKAGYKLVLCKDTFIHHYGSVSFREDSSYSKLMKVNAKKFEEKWGFNPIYSQNIRFEIINMMNSDPEAPLNVLEVGCACGGTLMNIKHRYPNSNLYGIEIDEAASSVASMIADVRNYDAERGLMEYDDNFFDYIILADVLEHLYDPWKVLRNLKRFLKTDGKLLVSIPNLMHYTVINGLLEGSFTYTEAGILDRTHVRFFTLHELKKMILQSGYYKLDIAAKTLSNQSKGITDRLSGIVSPAVMEQFNVYQYLVSAKKHDLDETFEYIMDHTEETQIIVNRVSAYTADEVIQSVLLSVNENQAELLNTIGVSHFSVGSYEKALPFFENAFYLDNNNEEVLYNISYFLCFIGESSNASQFIDRLREVNEKSYNQLLEVIKDFAQ